MKAITSKAFTLVELLIVIGIIGILAVTLLLNLNPAEAQKKARDTQRIKDLSNLQTAVEQMINDGNAIPTAGGDGALQKSDISSTNTCTSNWTNMHLCDYLRTVPVDPRNGASTTFVNSAGNDTTGIAHYRLRSQGTNYKLSARFESVSNASKISSDGGNNTTWFEIFNESTLKI